MRRGRKERKRRKKTQMFNKRLLKRYPWLMPRNAWTGKVIKDYDYLWTEYDCVPDGWRKAFGMMMLEEYDEEIRKYNHVRDYYVVQVKEKYGSLRWYDNGHYGKMGEINHKYEYISENICIMCGKEAPMIDDGWMSPWCCDCWVNNVRRIEQLYHPDSEPTPIETFIKEYEGYIYDKPKEDGTWLSNYFIIHKFSTDGDEEITYDISDTVNKIRDRQKKWIKYKGIN